MRCNTHQRKQTAYSRRAGGFGRGFCGVASASFFVRLCDSANTSRHPIVRRANDFNLCAAAHNAKG